MVYYIDASALAKAVVTEPGTDAMTAILDGANSDQTMTARLGLAEVASAVARLVRQGDLSSVEAEAVDGVLEEPEVLLS